MDTVKVKLVDAKPNEIAYVARIFGLEASDKMSKSELIALIRTSGFKGDEIEVMRQPVQPAPTAAPSVNEYGIPAQFFAEHPTLKMRLEDCQTVEKEDGTRSVSRKPRMIPRPYVLIHIPEQDKPGGKDSVMIGCNGVRFDAPRAEDCWIPIEYFLVLKNAQEYLFEELSDDPADKGGLKAPRVLDAIPVQYGRNPNTPKPWATAA